MPVAVSGEELEAHLRAYEHALSSLTPNELLSSGEFRTIISDTLPAP